MTLEADRAVDRRRLTRRLAFWRIAAVAALVVAGLALVSPIDTDKSGKHVSRLTVAGIIVSDPDRDRTLRDLVDDDDCKALILDIDSPGGTVVGGEALFRAVREVAAEKPVVAVIRETGTSAAYMVAAGAERIFAFEGSITGSIGVLLQTADLTGLMEKIGVKPETIKSSPLKAQPNPMEPFTEEAREATRKVVLDIHAMFKELVGKRRGLTAEEVETLADGRIFTGRQAKENGLVDALGGEPEARAWLAETHGIDADLPMVDVEIEREDGLLRSLLDDLEGKALFSERLRLDGLVSVWHPVFK